MKDTLSLGYSSTLDMSLLQLNSDLIRSNKGPSWIEDSKLKISR